MRIENITKKFGDFVAVNNVSLKIYKGEIFDLEFLIVDPVSERVLSNYVENLKRLGLAISRVFHRVCPDPLVIAILLTVLTFALALVFGNIAPEKNFGGRAIALLDAWRSSDRRPVTETRVTGTGD